jgi:hypothetical protein
MRSRATQVAAAGAWAIALVLIGYVLPRPALPGSPVTLSSAPVEPALLLAADPVTYTGTTTTITSSVRLVPTTVRVGPPDLGASIDPTQVPCHGGTLSVTWTVGNLEPTTAKTGIKLAIRLDGTPIAAGIAGGDSGLYNDRPMTLRGVVPCPAGQHKLDVVILDITGSFGLPYVQTPGKADPAVGVSRGFIASEIWSDSSLPVE